MCKKYDFMGFNNDPIFEIQLDQLHRHPWHAFALAVQQIAGKRPASARTGQAHEGAGLRSRPVMRAFDQHQPPAIDVEKAQGQAARCSITSASTEAG